MAKETTKKTKTASKRILEAQELERKAKQLRREEEEFWEEVKEIMPEIRERFPDKFEQICRTYGVKTEEEKKCLFAHLTTEKQVNYFNEKVKPTISHPPEESEAELQLREQGETGGAGASSAPPLGERR